MFSFIAMKNKTLAGLVAGILLVSFLTSFYIINKKQFFFDDDDDAEMEAANKLAPFEYWEMARNYPDFKMDLQAFNQAVAQCKAGMNALGKSGAFNNAWTLEGPTNIGGRITCVAVSPLNPDIIFVGGAYGGIFKTTDGGAHWRPVFDSTAYLSIACITIDPDSANIMYAGTGDPSTSYTAFTGNGIYKSVDAGETWTYIGLKETGIVSKIVVHPTNNQIMYAATMGFLMRRDLNRGLYKTIDGGQNWTNILSLGNETGVMNVVLDKNSPQVLYATSMRRIRTEKETIVHGMSTAIFKSTNGGNTWDTLRSGLPQGPWCKVNIELSPSNSNILYASIVDTTLQLKGIYKSVNAGNTWQNINPAGLDTNALGAFGWYFGEIRLNPFRNGELFLQGVDLWKSTNNGANWNYGAPRWFTYEVHADKHAMHFYSADHYLVATDGGLYETSDSGQTWAFKATIPITQFYHVGVNYWRPGVYYGGAQDNGTSAGNSNQPDNWERVLGGDGFRMAFSATNPDVIWASIQKGAIYYSTQGGINFSPATNGVDDNDRKNWDSPFLLSKHNTDAFLGTQYLYQTTNYETPYFNKISPDLTDGNIYGEQFHSITTIGQSELSENAIYAGTSDGNVWCSLNKGSNWLNISAGLPDRYVTCVTTSYQNSATVYVSHSGYRSDDYLPHLHRSINTGLSWVDISGNMPAFAINDIQTFNLNDSLIAVASDGGVFITQDAGTTWTRMGNNMPVFPVFDIEFDTLNYKLIAGTFARSMMSYDIKNLFPKRSGVNEVRANEFAVQLYPNPAGQMLHISMDKSMSEIKIYSLKGELVKELKTNAREEDLNLEMLDAGIYLLRVKTNTNSTCMKKFVKL